MSTISLAFSWANSAEVRPSSFDFGAAPLNSKLAQTIWVKNPDAAPVRILWVDPGCGCGSALITDSTIRPGDSLAVRIEYETGRMAGEFSFTFRALLTDRSDPHTAHFTVLVSENIRMARPIGVGGNSLRLLKRDNRIESGSILLYNNTSVALSLTASSPDEAEFTVYAPEMVKAQSPISLRIAPKGASNQGLSLTSVTIEASWEEGSMKRRGRVTIPVFVGN